MKNLITIIFLTITSFSTAQEVIEGIIIDTYIEEVNCVKSGVITFSLEDALAPEHALPYDIDIENLSEGRESYHEMIESDFSVYDVASGDYLIRIYFDDGCEVAVPVTLDYAEIECNLYGEVGFAQCGSGGSIYTEFNCLTAANVIVSYHWSNGASTPNITDLVPGLYTLKAFDDQGCRYIESFEVTNLEASAEIILVNRVHAISCSDVFDHGDVDCTGELEIKEVHGWDIHWIGIPNEDENSSAKVTDLCDGEYTVEMSKNDCVVTRTFSICCCNQTDNPICSDLNVLPKILGDVTNTTNATSADGSIVVDLLGTGSNTLLLTWTGPYGFKAYEQNISDLVPGTYNLTISNGCIESSRTFIVGNQEYCDAIDIQIIGKLKCILQPELARGEIDLVIFPPETYIYQWSNGSTSAELSSFDPGEYTVTVTSSVGCTAVQSFVLEDTELPLEATVDLSVPTGCQTLMEIQGEVNIDSGNPPFTFLWSTGSTESVSDMEVGHNIYYSVSVTDACGFRTVLDGNYNCQDDNLCNDDCIRIRKTGNKFCFDLCGDILEFNCDQWIIESNCNDGVRRTVSGNGGNGENLTFIGDKLENGDDKFEQDITRYELPDSYYWITNHLTGCKKLVVMDWPDRNCDGTIMKLLKFIIDEFGSGNSGGGSNFDSDCLEGDWEVEYYGSECRGSMYCDYTGEFKEIYVPYETCYIPVAESNIFYTYCPEDCQYIGSPITMVLDEEVIGFSECDINSDCFLNVNLASSCNDVVNFQNAGEDNGVILYSQSHENDLVQLLFIDTSNPYKLNPYHENWFPDSLKIESIKINLSGALLHLKDRNDQAYIKYISSDNDFEYYYDTLSTEIVENITTDSLQGTKFCMHYIDANTNKRYIRTYNYNGVISNVELQIASTVEHVYWSTPNSYVELYSTTNSQILNCVGDRNFTLSNRISRSCNITSTYLLNDKLIISGFFKGSIEIDGITYTSWEQGTNYSSIVMVYDDAQNLLQVKTYESIIYKTIYVNNIVYVAGYMIDSNFKNILEADVMIEAQEQCGFIDIFSIEDSINIASRKKDNILLEVEIFPNPTNDELNIIVNQKKLKTYDIEVFDISGRLVLREKGVNYENHKLNISTLEDGIYLLSVISNGLQIHSESVVKM